jgi:oxygen-independent coproporphyrinogen III oxidase
MYGLPAQTVANTLSTIDAIAALRPERLALFGYAHVPWMKPHQKLIHDADLPNAEARLAQSQAASRYLTGKGWRSIGLDHFALPHDSLAAADRAGRLRRNFQGYTTDAAPVLIGLGASSISRTPLGFVQNLAQERDWRAAVGEGRLPSARGVVLTARDRFVGELIERLMCDFAIDVDGLIRKHGRDPGEIANAWSRLATFEADGLVELASGQVTVTPLGRPFVRAVCAAFDPGARQFHQRHARIV